MTSILLYLQMLASHPQPSCIEGPSTPRTSSASCPNSCQPLASPRRIPAFSGECIWVFISGRASFCSHSSHVSATGRLGASPRSATVSRPPKRSRKKATPSKSRASATSSLGHPRAHSFTGVEAPRQTYHESCKNHGCAE